MGGCCYPVHVTLIPNMTGGSPWSEGPGAQEPPDYSITGLGGECTAIIMM